MRSFPLVSLIAVVVLGLVACGGGAERTIVQTYFDAVQGGDETAAKRVSLVEFPGEVSSWEIVEVGPASNEPFELEQVNAKYLETEAELEKGHEANQAFLDENVELYEKYKKAKEADPEGTLEGELAAFDEEWTTRLERQEKMTKELASMMEEIKRLKAAATLSLNTAVNERFSGEIEGKELRLKVNDKDYTLKLKRYVLQDTERNIAPIARWIITDIEEREA